MSTVKKKIDLSKYLNLNLFEELKLGEWPEVEREAFLESFANIIHMRIIARLLEMLSDNQKDQMERLLSAPIGQVQGDAALYEFLMKEVPTFEEMVAEEIGNYKKELIDQMLRLNKQAGSILAGKK